MIEAHNLSKIFRDKKRGEIHAVSGVSFRCEPGQIYGLLGANGAGKTTTLRMLATILEPTRDGDSCAGFDVVEEPEKVRANVGFLSTATALVWAADARAKWWNISARLHGLDGADAASGAWMNFSRAGNERVPRPYAATNSRPA